MGVKDKKSNALPGRIAEWDATKGYGYLESANQRLFAHVKDFKDLHRRVEVGDRVSFVAGTDKHGRPCAVQIRLLNDAGSLGGEALALVLVLLVLPFIAVYRVFGLEPASWTMAAYATMSLITYPVYLFDKRNAREKEQRRPEKWIHLIELLGGWPGAFVAQRRLKHKSSKLSYQFVFWLIVALHQFVALELFRGWPILRGLLDTISP